MQDRVQSEELFDKISQIEGVGKMTTEQIQEHMKKNLDNIRKVKFSWTREIFDLHRLFFV